MLKRRLIFLSTISAVLLNAVSLVPWSCIGNAQENSTIAATAIVQDPIVGELLQQVNGDRALNDIRQLSGEIPVCVGTDCTTISNRFTGSIGLEWAMDYLHDNLVSMGYSTELRDWSASGYTGQNLVARKEGAVTPTEEIYIVAHVDGVRSTGGRGPAADDNGSGTVDLLELARIIKDHQFERTIVLLFSTGEEQGTLGVTAFFKHLSQLELSHIKFAIDVDMVGFDDNGDRVMELWHGDDPASVALTQMMSDTIRAYQLQLDPRLTTGCG
jgi:hypothetical protein